MFLLVAALAAPLAMGDDLMWSSYPSTAAQLEEATGWTRTPGMSLEVQVRAPRSRLTVPVGPLGCDGPAATRTAPPSSLPPCVCVTQSRGHARRIALQPAFGGASRV